jgi:hypothetical protein
MIFFPNQMTQTTEVLNAFSRALDELNFYNSFVYEYWLSEICIDDGDFISLDESKLTVENLVKIQKEVKKQKQLVDS